MDRNIPETATDAPESGEAIHSSTILKHSAVNSSVPSLQTAPPLRNSNPAPSQNVTISSTDNVLLESEFNSFDKSAKYCAIVCHPFGPLGGSMFDNNVAVLFRLFSVKKDFMAVRFNFRGVGNSSGSTSRNSQAEMQDLLAVVAYTKTISTDLKYIIVGYSYGAVVAGLALTSIENILLFISVSYPYSVLFALTFGNSWSAIEGVNKSTCNKLMIMGESDLYIMPHKSEYTNWAKSIGKSILVERVDHFWVGYSETLQNIVKDQIAIILGEPRN